MFLGVACVLAQEADSHVGLAQDIMSLLRETDACLAGCTDSASCAAAEAKLRELARQTEDLTARQAQLPDPTVQDYMAVQNLGKEFMTLERSIREHLKRLEQAGLLTPGFRKILVLPE